MYFSTKYRVDNPIIVKIAINGIPPEKENPTKINIKIFA